MSPRETLRNIARKGSFKVNEFVIFPSVFKKLKKEGFELIKLDTQKGKRDKVFVVFVSWENAYKDGVPTAVSEFISGKSSEYPEADIQNFSQKLFVLASKARSK